MLITRKSFFTGEDQTMEIAITPRQLDAWENGALIQDVAPNLSADDREFIISGLTAEDWKRLSDHAA